MKTQNILILLCSLFLSTQVFAQSFWQQIGKKNLNIELQSLHKGALNGPVHLWFEIYLSHDGYSDQQLSESLYHSSPYYTRSQNYIRPNEILTIPKANLKDALIKLQSKVQKNLGPEVKLNPSLKLKLYFSKATRNPEVLPNSKTSLLADEILAISDEDFSRVRKVYNNGRYYGFTYSEINLVLIAD